MSKPLYKNIFFFSRNSHMLSILGSDQTLCAFENVIIFNFHLFASSLRSTLLTYYTMILQRIRIIVGRGRIRTWDLCPLNLVPFPCLQCSYTIAFEFKLPDNNTQTELCCRLPFVTLFHLFVSLRDMFNLFISLVHKPQCCVVCFPNFALFHMLLL